MINEEQQQVIRVCGLGFDYYDIPAYIRQRDEIEKDDWEFAEKAEQEKDLVH